MSPLNWEEVMKLGAPGADLNTIKDKLPIAYILSVANIPAVQGADGKLHALCPFHDDEEPSFDVGKDDKGSDRWWCSPCKANGFGEGDVFDLIRMLPDFDADSMGDALRVGRDLLNQLELEGWQGPQILEPKAFDRDYAMIVTGSEPDMPFLRKFVEDKEYPFTAEYLVEQFGVTTFNNWVVAPHYEKGEVVGYKHRNGADTGFISAAGSKLRTHFYNEAALQGSRKPVLIVESESDVWVAQYLLENYTVIGLPAGAATRPNDLVERLAGRQVVVAFDGDEAGRSANFRWWAALLPHASSVRIVPMPDGTDAASVTNLDVLLLDARTVMEKPYEIVASPGYSGYVRNGQKEQLTQLTNWTFIPKRELRGDEGTAYEGILMPMNIQTVVMSQDLKNKNSAIAWSARHGVAFYGSDRDAQQILALLQHEGPFLSTGRMTTIAGFHDGQFVYPGGKIGQDYWVYLSQNSNVDLDSMVQISDDDWKIEQLLVLRRLHQQAVMDPILCWLAVAPIRSLYREFPILAILAGSAGLGKTTLTETVVRAFSGTSIFETLMNTTKYAMSAIASSNNFAPVWYDEYKLEAGQRNMDDIRQMIREAYNGKGGSKGGMQDGWASVTKIPITAPIIISGEESFTETSITERSVTVVLPVSGRNSRALQQVQSWGETGLPYQYLKFLYDGLRDGSLPSFAALPAGPDELPPRSRNNLGLLYLGWELLLAFLQKNNINTSRAGWIEPDFSLVIDEAVDASHSNPIRDAVLWAKGQPESHTFLKIDGDVLSIQVENFMQFTIKNSSMRFPGGRKATERTLKALYGAEEKTVIIEQREKQVLIMSYDRVQQDIREVGSSYDEDYV